MKFGQSRAIKQFQKAVFVWIGGDQTVFPPGIRQSGRDGFAQTQEFCSVQSAIMSVKKGKVEKVLGRVPGVEKDRIGAFLEKCVPEIRIRGFVVGHPVAFAGHERDR